MTRFRVLLVDEEEEFVRTYSERLQWRWFNPEGTLAGEHALRSVQSRVPGVMVLDLTLPGMNGTEVLRRAQKAYPAAQVIILSDKGSSSWKDDQAPLPDGSRYMEKPVDIDELLETLNHVYKDKMTDLVVAAPTFSGSGEFRSAIFISEKE